MSQYPRLGRLNVAMCAGVVVAAAAVLAGWCVGQWRQHREAVVEPASEPSAGGDAGARESRRGEVLYLTTCASCHGPDGRGDGEAAANLKPPPRDFAARPWRFEPTKDSIRRAILQGIPGTAMPAGQATLAAADVELLVDYVHGLATCRPPVHHEASLAEQRLRAAQFVDVRGLTPPPLRVTDASGQVTTLAELRGRLVIVHFWGMACLPCLREMPDLHRMATAYAARGLTVLHVCVDADDARAAQALLDRLAPGARALTEETGLGLAAFEVQTLPNVWLIGPDATAIGRASGAVDWRSADVIKLLEHSLP